jgi:GNAT superfamily N-acetyltransferase
MDVQIRLARRTDLASIIELSKGTYEGHDYLPLSFLQWLEEPNRRVIVAEKRGLVIGIRAFHIVDGGKTVVSHGLRVHSKYRGQGISTVLIQAQQQYVRTEFPSVVTERYTTQSTNVGRLAIQRKSAGESLVSELGIIAFYANSTAYTSQTEIACANEQVKGIDATEFQKLIEDGRLDNVLKKDTLVVDWEPFKALSCNVASGLFNEDDCLFVSENIHSEKEIQCFSHGRLSPRVKCQHWVATIYTENLKMLKMHIAKQLKYAKVQSKEKKFIFSCSLPTCFVSDAKQYVCEEFSLEYVEFFNFNLLLFEKSSCV